MNPSEPNPAAEARFSKEERWHDEFARLRAIALDCRLTEAVKWGAPCYTHEGRNIVLIHGFKDYCALLFFKGALLKDPDHLLIQQTENVQAGRQIRFTGTDEITRREALLKAYIDEAIAVEQAGLKVPLKQTTAFAVPEEFRHKLNEIPGLKSAFEALTPGRQRAYLLHFAAPKQAKTRISRIDKSLPRILDGKGLDD